MKTRMLVLLVTLFALIVTPTATPTVAATSRDTGAYCPDVYRALTFTNIAIAGCYGAFQGEELAACVAGGNAVYDALLAELATCVWIQD